jgi:hypothetical protein
MSQMSFSWLQKPFFWLTKSEFRQVAVAVWLIFLAGCLVRVFILYTGDPNTKFGSDNCQKLADEAEWLAEDSKGLLRIAAMGPNPASFPGRFCLVMAGAIGGEIKPKAPDAEKKLREAIQAAETTYRARESAAKQAEKDNPRPNDTVDNQNKWDRVQRDARSARMNEARRAIGNAPRDLQTTDLSVFVNGARQPFLARKIQLTPLPQAILIEMNNDPVPSGKPDAPHDAAKLWRGVLGGPTVGDSSEKGFSGVSNRFRELTIAVGRGGGDIPETVYPHALLVKLHDWLALTLGGVSLCAFLLVFLGIARHSSLLRDGSLTNTEANIPKIAALEASTDAARLDALPSVALLQDPDEKKKQRDTELQRIEGEIATLRTELFRYISPYSLARTQMAFWGIIVFCSFVFLWLTLGEINGVMNASVLSLLGISAATGIISASLPAAANPTAVTQSFWHDITNDGDGPKFHRIQAVAWTVLLGLVFAWTLFSTFSFVNLDPNLLILIGFANSSYVGFKMQETRK